MSRTNKDQPYWVKVNNNTQNLPTYEWHEHLTAGEPVYKDFVVRDAKGNPVKEEVTEETTWYEITLANGYAYVCRQPEGYFFYQKESEVVRSRVSSVTTRTWTRTKTERKLIGYRPTECTINDPLNWDTGSRDNITHICSRGLQPTKTNRPHHRSQRTLHHKSARGQERAALASARKSYNTSQEVDDKDCDKVITREHEHNGYWN